MGTTRQTARPKRSVEARSVEDRFAAVAEDLDLELTTPESDNRMVGIAIAPVAHDAKGTGGGKPQPVGAKDTRAIKKLLAGWHELSPSELPEKWTNFATDPYIVVLPDGLKRMNETAMKAWLRSKQYKEAMEQFGPYSPRRAKVSEVKIVYLGNLIAGATYATNEKGEFGVASGNVCAILRKADAGWRIAALSASTHFTPKPKTQSKAKSKK